MKAIVLLMLILAGCAHQTPAPSPATRPSPAQPQAARPQASTRPTIDTWVGVWTSPAETSGYSGTVLVIEKDYSGERLRYRRSFYSDVRIADAIEEKEKRGQALADGDRLFIPEAHGYQREGQVSLSADIERYTLRTVNGQSVLMRDDALKAFDEQNKLYDYGLLIRVADKVEWIADLRKVKKASIKLLYTDPAKPWKDPFVHGPNER